MGFDRALHAQRTPHHSGVAGPIPPQRLPRVMRRAIQIGVLPAVVMEEWTLRLLRVVLPPRHRREGACRNNGACCKYIVIGAPRAGRLTVFGRLTAFARRATVWWAKEVNGFYERRFSVEDADYDTHVFSCRHLTLDNRCDNYRLRPMVCRQWPRIDFFSASAVHKGCGFRIVERDTKRSGKRRALPVLPPMTPEQSDAMPHDDDDDDAGTAAPKR